MSDFTATPHCIEATVIAVGTNGKRMYNVLNFSSPDALPGSSDVQDVADLVAAWVDSDYHTIFTDKLEVIQVHARSMAEEPGPEADAFPATGTGASSGDELAMSTTCVAGLNTGVTGQSRHGRFNAFQAVEGDMTGGLFTPTYATSLRTVLAVLITSSGVASLPWSVWSRHLGLLFRINNITVNRVPRTLRSRAIDHGI